MSFWVAASLFFGGALCHKAVTYFMNIRQGRQFTKEATEHLITFMNLMAFSFAEATNMKYLALEETNMTEEEVLKLYLIDRKMYEAWKKSLATRAFPQFPAQHMDLLPTFDWDGALAPLENIYYNNSNSQEEQEGTSNE